MDTTAVPVGGQTDVNDHFQVFLFLLSSEINQGKPFQIIFLLLYQ